MEEIIKGKFTDRLINYPFVEKVYFWHNGKYVRHYSSERVKAQEINGVLTVLRVDIDGYGNWWYLNPYQSDFLLDNPEMDLKIVIGLFKFEYPKDKKWK
jgi:hypothetical protein